MIDIENAVFTMVYNALNEAFPGIEVYGEHDAIPSTFPCVYVEQMDSYNDTRYHIATRKDTFDIVTFDVTVYSNAPQGRKTECKNIMKVIDDTFILDGFTRSTLNFVDLTDEKNSVVARLFSRYTAEVGANGIIYTRR